MVEIINSPEVNNPEIRPPEVDDLKRFKKTVTDDKKPYVEDIIESMRAPSNMTGKILGYYDLKNVMIGMVYFLEEDENSIYLSRLITAENHQHYGIASNLVNYLKLRYDAIRTIPIPLGDDFYSDIKMQELKDFYVKRGFEDGRIWNRGY